MNRTSVMQALAVSLLLTHCGPKVEPAEPEAAPPEPEPAQPAPEPAAVAAEEKAEPTPEELERQTALQKLKEDRARLKEDHTAEVARWTPELHAEAKTLAEKSYASGRAAIDAALKAKYRKPANAARDKDRHPLETLEFFGFQPTQTVLEYGPGEGYYTELLAPALAKKGQLIITNTDPNGPPEARSTYYAERVQLLLERSPELFGKVKTVIFDPSEPKLGLEGSVDLALLMRSLHGMVNAGSLDAWLKEIHTALKPKGVLGVEQHRSNPDANPEESAKLGYLPEAWVIQKIEAAGFTLQKKSEINANPKDTKDHPKGVWNLPPSLADGDQDREKYVGIGESDRMTLKFIKK